MRFGYQLMFGIPRPQKLSEETYASLKGAIEGKYRIDQYVNIVTLSKDEEGMSIAELQAKYPPPEKVNG